MAVRSANSRSRTLATRKHLAGMFAQAISSTRPVIAEQQPERRLVVFAPLADPVAPGHAVSTGLATA
jgi:hypothetical protein